MARLRLGVVLLVPQPVASHVDGLRRALGDGALDRIAPHVTLIPPVNVAERDLPSVLASVRSAASTSRPLSLRIGPVESFAPVNPVAYLAVRGPVAEVEALHELRSKVRTGSLERPDQHDFVPHVTVADELSAARLAAAVAALSDFEAELVIDRVHVMFEQPGRVWAPIGDAPLGEHAAVVGRGSLPLELTVTGRPDLEAAALLALDQEAAGLPFALAARRDGVLLAAAWGWTGAGVLQLADLVVSSRHRGEGIGRHVLAAVEALGVRRGCHAAGAAAPLGGAPAALLRGAGWSAGSVAERGGSVHWERALAPAEDG